MTLISSLSRPNVLSYNDLGIQRGLKMLYNLDKIDKETFNQYAKLFSPYCTIASFYLWEIASNKTSLKPIR